MRSKFEGSVKSHNDTNICHSRESGNPFPDQVEDKHFRCLQVPGFPLSRE